MLPDKYFAQDGALCYDFTSDSDVTIVIFYGAVDAAIRADITPKMSRVKKAIQDRGRDVNLMIITDGNNPQYSCNFHGVAGVVDSLDDLSNFISKKLYGPSRRTIVITDCGGAIPALISSSMVKYHSLLFTTPYFEVINFEDNYTVKDASTAYSINSQTWIRKNLASYGGMFNCLSYLDNFINTSDTRVSMHFAKSIYGSDLKMREFLNIYKHKPNVKTTDWEMPPDLNPHLLAQWLAKDGRMLDLICNEIDFQTACIQPKF